MRTTGYRRAAPLLTLALLAAPLLAACGDDTAADAASSAPVTSTSRAATAPAPAPATSAVPVPVAAPTTSATTAEAATSAEAAATSAEAAASAAAAAPSAAVADVVGARAPVASPAASRWPDEALVSQGGQYWGVYLAAGDPAQPADGARVQRVGDQLTAAGYRGSRGGLCDDGVSDALGIAQGSSVVAVYFGTRADALAFIDRWDRPYVGYAQVRTYCAD